MHDHNMAYSIHNHTYQTLHDLTKASMDSNYMQKMNIIPQIVVEILKFKQFCNWIGREYFGQ